MDKPRIISTLVMLLVLTQDVNAFGSGAPDSVCETLMPSHGATPQQGQAPYQVTTSGASVAKGGQISVTLTGSSPFIGFFMRARQSNQYIGGTFQQTDLGSLRCNNQGMTHASSESKFKVVAVWTAPENIASLPMQFEVTVVQQRPIFWTQVRSADVTISPLDSSNTPLNSDTTNSSFTLPSPNGQDPNATKDPNAVPLTNSSNPSIQDASSFPQQSNGINPGFQNQNSPTQSNTGNLGVQGSNGFPQQNTNQGFQDPFSSQPSPASSGVQNSNTFPQPSVPGSGFQDPNSSPQPGMPNSGFQDPNSSPQPGMPNSGFQGPNSIPQPSAPGSGFQDPNSSPQPGMPNSGFQDPNSSPQPGMPNSGFQDQSGFPQTNVNNQNPQDSNPFSNPSTTNPALQDPNVKPQMNVTNPLQQDPNSIPQPNSPNPIPGDPNTIPTPNASSPIPQDPNTSSLGASTAATTARGAPGSNAGGQPTTTTSSTKMDTTVIPGGNSTADTVPGRANSLAETKSGKLPLQAAQTISVDPDCGKSKGCYHNCQDGDPCNYLVAWTYETEKVHFEFLYHSSSNSDQWIGLGLSHDTVMGDDSVLECVADNGQVHVRTSYNNGKDNEYPVNKSAAVSDTEGSFKDGFLACSFRRKISYPGETRVFDLSFPYYLMVATGAAVSGNKLPHSYEKLPKVSAEKVSLQQVASISGSRDPFYPLVKAHGTIMTLAWMFFASCGLVIAKHGRSMFNNSKPFGIHVWFHIHRFCMVMTAFLTILGCVIIVIESNGYSVIPETPGKAYRVLHPPLGLILVIVTLVNPLMALFRPDPKSPSRPVFRWSHWGIGIFAWATSFVLTVIGLDLSKSQGEVEAIYVVFGFIAYQIVIDIFIRVTASFCGCFKPGCCESKHSYDFNMADISRSGMNRGAAGEVNSDTEDTNKEDQKVQRAKNITLSITLVVHMVLSACFSIAVLYFFLRHPVGSLPSVPGQDGSKH